MIQVTHIVKEFKNLTLHTCVDIVSEWFQLHPRQEIIYGRVMLYLFLQPPRE